MCGIYGGIVKGGKVSVHAIEGLGKAAQSRGADATGVSYMTADGKFMFSKAPVPAKEFKFKKHINENSVCVIGHTRAATHGSCKINDNNHPFVSDLGKFTLVHNGVIWNYDTIQKTEELPKTHIQCDSYAIAQLLDKYVAMEEGVSIGSVKRTAEKLGGSFAVPILAADGNLHMIRHSSPVVWYVSPNAIYFASTKEILMAGLEYGDIDTEAGWIFEQPDDTIITVNIETLEVSNIKFTARKTAYFQDWDDDDFYGYAGYDHTYRHGAAYTKTTTPTTPANKAEGVSTLTKYDYVKCTDGAWRPKLQAIADGLYSEPTTKTKKEDK